MSACIAYWEAWSKALTHAKKLHPDARVLAGGDANVILGTLHPDKKQDKLATSFEKHILRTHDLVLANLACTRRTHKVHAIDLLVHSRSITVTEFEVHDAEHCRCGQPYCGPIAGSDHFFVTATLEVTRPIECTLEPRWAWSRSMDWNAAVTSFAPHFTLLATWITIITTTTQCADRAQNQALVGCLCYIWYAMVFGAIRHCGRWRSTHPGRRVQPWWDAECNAAALRWSKSYKDGNDIERRAATAHYKRTIRLAKLRRNILLQKNANCHRMINAPTNTLPFPRTRTSTKLTIIDPDTGHTVHGVHALRVWRLHMMRHLTDQPATIIRDAFKTGNQQPEAEQIDPEACHSDTSGTLTSGSDTSEAMHTRRTRIGPGHELLLEQASSEEEDADIPHTTSTTDNPNTQRSSINNPRQSTIT